MKLVLGLLMIAVAMFGIASCGLPAKVRAGYCSRPMCHARYHEPNVICKFCGNCDTHCPSNFFYGPNP